MEYEEGRGQQTRQEGHRSRRSLGQHPHRTDQPVSMPDANRPGHRTAQPQGNQASSRAAISAQQRHILLSLAQPVTNHRTKVRPQPTIHRPNQRAEHRSSLPSAHTRSIARDPISVLAASRDHGATRRAALAGAQLGAGAVLETLIWTRLRSRNE